MSKRHIAILCGGASLLVTAANILKVLDDLKYWQYFIGTFFMLLLAIADYSFYKFYPLEAGVFIDVSGRNQDDLLRF